MLLAKRILRSKNGSWGSVAVPPARCIEKRQKSNASFTLQKKRAIVKKLSSKRRCWLIARARNERRRTILRNKKHHRGYRPKRNNRNYNERVFIWQGGDVEEAICENPPTYPPRILCFEKNLKETTEYFERIRAGFFDSKLKRQQIVHRPKRPNAKPRISRYSDFSTIEEISTSAAVVLAADYERLAIISNDIPPTVNLDKWKTPVFTKLFQLGFFEIVGLSNADRVLSEQGSTMTMPIISGQNADDLRRVDEGLNMLASFLGWDDGLPDAVQIPMITVISEALTNVTNHAYSPEFEPQYPHVGKFWISATADRDSNSLTIVVYDQGATIPVTYPRARRIDHVERFLRRAIRRDGGHAYANDGTYVRAALRYGGSRTDKLHRGKGFPQMLETLDQTGAGNVTVRSRGGWCMRKHNGRLESDAIEHSIGGTLIEWTVILNRNPAYVSDGSQ